MAGMIYEFIEQLSIENALYEKLIGTANEKRSHLVKGELEKISEVNKQEEKIVSVIRTCEKKRTELMNDIAMILNLNAQGITITQIEGAIVNQKDEAKALGEIKQALKKNLAELKVLNDENMSLINQSLEYAQFSVNVLQSSMGSVPLTANYGSSADKEGNSFFDTKQ